MKGLLCLLPLSAEPAIDCGWVTADYRGDRLGVVVLDDEAADGPLLPLRQTETAASPGWQFQPSFASRQWVLEWPRKFHLVSNVAAGVALAQGS